MKFVSYDIVFQEVPNEISLALNISGCPNRCPGCHSPHLIEDCGEELSREAIDALVESYRASISCVCFMGGDNSPREVEALGRHVQQKWGLKSAWYSGLNSFPQDMGSLNYVKLGGYNEEFGGLKNPNTNQRMYRLHTDATDTYEDITALFWK